MPVEIILRFADLESAQCWLAEVLDDVRQVEPHDYSALWRLALGSFALLETIACATLASIAADATVSDMQSSASAIPTTGSLARPSPGPGSPRGT